MDDYSDYASSLRGDLDLMLDIARRAFSWVGSSGTQVVREGEGFGGIVNDTELTADRAIGDALLSGLRKLGHVRAVHIEGRPTVVCTTSADADAFIDPLDGSLNYLMRNGSLGLPFSSVITIMKACDKPRFGDVHEAGIVDLRSGDRWTAVKADGTQLNGAPVRTMSVDALDLSRMVVVGELYYPQNRELVTRMFKGERGWLRNCGSAAYEMALVASGQAAAFICDRQKTHELGAGYLLVKEAGGVGVDLDGIDLADREFRWDKQVSVILAANQTIADDLVSRAKKAKK